MLFKNRIKNDFWTTESKLKTLVFYVNRWYKWCKSWWLTKLDASKYQVQLWFPLLLTKPCWIIFDMRECITGNCDSQWEVVVNNICYALQWLCRIASGRNLKYVCINICLCVIKFKYWAPIYFYSNLDITGMGPLTCQNSLNCSSCNQY